MRTANTPLKTGTQRQRLKSRAAPYFNTIAPRRLLGYIKVAGEMIAGRWVAQLEIGRTETGQPQRRRKSLGIADDFAQANGCDVLSYRQALATAIEWQPSSPDSAASRGAFTVRDAVAQHRDFAGKRGNKTERAKLAAYNRLRWNVLGERSNGKPRVGVNGLGAVPVASLTTELLKAWRDGMIRHDLKVTDERKHIASRASAERAWSDFRSCLEQGYKKESNGIPREAAYAWRNVESLGKKGNRRLHHFETMDEARCVIDKCRENGDHAAADLFEAYILVGSRPGGELGSLTISDFDAERGLLAIPDRSETVISKTGARKVVLTADACVFFARISAGRPRTAPLLSGPDGERWDMKQRQRYFKDVLLRAGAPKEAVPYSFRHTYISRNIGRGVPPAIIAKQTGTSIAMIEQVYGKPTDKEVRQLLEAMGPQLRPELGLVKPGALKDAA